METLQSLRCRYRQTPALLEVEEGSTTVIDRIDITNTRTELLDNISSDESVNCDKVDQDQFCVVHCILKSKNSICPLM